MDIQNKICSHYIAQKAGMSSVNAAQIAKKVAELTKGSPKDLHEKQLQKKRALQVTAMLQKIMKYKIEDRQQIKAKWQKKIQHLQSQRPLQRYWAHFDFDMFYVACELLDKPDHKDLPCAVGGQNSVLCTANYAARLFGVRSAMPTFIAKKLCPQLILFKPNFDKYRKYSDIFRDILRKFDQNLESMGLDEAYIDLTTHLKQKSREQQQQFLKNIRKQIFDKTKLTVSCGVGANKLLAKMASQVNKPNGQFILENKSAAILQFMKDKKIRKIHGIGPVNQYFLKGLGLETARDLLLNLDILSICFSQNSCQFFVAAALGLGHIQHQFKERKSVGKSQTFRPCSQKQFIQNKLLQLCQQVQHELEQLGLVSINVVLSYQTQNYEKKDKTFNLDKYTNDKENFFGATIQYLKNTIIIPQKNIRLLGIKCSNLIKADEWKRKTLQNYFAKAKEKEKKGTKLQKQQVKSEATKKEEQKQKTESKKSKQSQLLSQIKQKSQFICPICNQQVQCMNNLSAFNRHIDKCLKNIK